MGNLKVGWGEFKVKNEVVAVPCAEKRRMRCMYFETHGNANSEREVFGLSLVKYEREIERKVQPRTGHEGLAG